MPDTSLARFAPAWSRLDPQLASVVGAVFTRWGDDPPVYELSPTEARQALLKLQLFWSAGAPAIGHVEERTIAGASGPIPACRHRHRPSSSCTAAAGSCATSTCTTALPVRSRAAQASDA